MALTDAYARSDEYRAVFTKYDGEDDEQIDRDLLLISRLLERKLGRLTFNRDATDQTFVVRMPATRAGAPYGWAESENPYRYGGYSRRLSTPDLVSVTSIRVDTDHDGLFTDESPLAATDYVLLPSDAPQRPEPEPYACIELVATSTIGGFPASTDVQIVGIRGWPAVPPAIKRATIELVGILRLESPRATRTVTALDQVVGTSKQAADILEDLSHLYTARLPLIGGRR